ncbi:hypothetical protein FGF1_05820 [Flavobacteriaceae bacterium GF1]
MKNVVRSLLLFSLIAVSQSCDDRDDNLTGPNIRIQNRSGQNFSRVEVRVDTLFYENVAADSFSDYMEFDLAFQQDTLRVEADSTVFNFVPDTVTSPLPIGLYTYQLDIDQEGELIFNFKID